ncbi:MAG: dihydrodipicolinate synthase family protein [Rhodospirillales bacterium]|nr:dihydrodipicolinate synthase family protein [Rhodospirillales bacterium]
MDKRNVDWHGPWVALVTPFDQKGAIDEAGFRRNVELVIRNGVTGLLVSGCTGEFWAMTNEERTRLFKVCVDAARGRVPVVAGTSSIRTDETIEMTAAAKAAGCAGAMVMPPFFVKPSADDIVGHFQAVSDAVKIPLMVYNIPSANVNAISPEFASRLADVENVVAIKESSFDLVTFYRTVALAGDRTHLLGMGLPGLMVGGAGTIGVNANYWDEESCALYAAFKKGDRKEANRLEDRSQEVRNCLGTHNIYVAIKTAMNLFGRPGGYPRKPLLPLSDADQNTMRKAMERFGVRPPAALAQVAE